MKKKDARKILSLFLSFLVALLLTISFISLSFAVGICNKEIFLHSVANSDYYDTLYERIQGNLDYLLFQAKIPKEVGAEVLSKRQVYVDGKMYILSRVEGKKKNIDTREIEKKLRENIENYLIEEEIPLKGMNRGINEIIDTIVIDYKNTLEFKYADYFQQYQARYTQWIWKIIPICGGLIFVIALILCLLYHRKHRAIRYLSYATLTATFMNTWFTWHCASLLPTWKFFQEKSYYSKMIAAYFKEGISQGYYISLMGLVLFLILLTLTKVVKKYS